GDSNCAADAETPLREIQAVAHCPSDPIERNPLDKFAANTALPNEILQQPADIIVGKRGANGGLQAEAAAQAPRHIVFAAAFPNLEFARGADAAFARVEPQHDFAQSNQIVLAGTGEFDVQNGHSAFS